MSQLYLQGGDSYKFVLGDDWAAQTFRPTQDHTLEFIDLNIRPGLISPVPMVLVYRAGADHLPSGDCLSTERNLRWDLSFPIRDWLWYEKWGKTLRENHPWNPYWPGAMPEISIKNGEITIVNPGNEGCGIEVTIPPGTLPLLDPDGRHLYFHHHSPHAFGHPEKHYIPYLLWTYGPTGSYLIEPLISHGTDWGPFGPYQFWGPTKGAFDLGKGPGVLDFTAKWIEGRTNAGLPADPTGWEVEYFHIANEQPGGTQQQTVTNSYIGFAHEKFLPPPKDYYPIKDKGWKWPWSLYRARFIMDPVKLYADRYYIIITKARNLLNIWGHWWQFDKDDAQYPRGIRLSTLDGGATWEKHFNDDHLFAEFGTPIIPKPKPPPPVINVAPLTIDKTLLDTGFIIYMTTNTPCHLYMLWTNKKPDKHTIPRLRRGIPFNDDIEYCFVSWHLNEQEEAGDTFTHSFVKDNWPECETRWFTFRALVNNEWSPSVGPIFELHFGYKLYECDGPELAHYPVNADYTMYAVFKPTSNYAPEHLQATFGRYGEPGEVTLSFFHLGPGGWPAGPVLDSCTRTITDIPEIPYFGHFTFQFHKMHLFKDTWYCLKAECKAEPPISAQWKGWPINICPDSYGIIHRLYDDRWFSVPELQFYFLIRGQPL